MRLFFEVAYKGTNYHGWQIQPNAKTIQEELNSVLSTLCQQEINIVGSGRTDTGVHCKQQFFHADINIEISYKDLQHKMNSMLPFDIAINSIRGVKESAHARFDATSRSYQYFINTRKDPFQKEFSYFFSQVLNIKTMNEAASLLIEGEQDYECFSRVKTEVNNFMCHITKARWIEAADGLMFEISANRFLRGMVRAIVGTLLEVGLNRLSIEEFKEIISSKNRKKAGRAVPPEGLFLSKVIYPNTIFTD